MSEIDTELNKLGFSAGQVVTHRRTIADLIAPGKRAGIYVLRFDNDSLYVGQSVNVAARFHQHRARFDDFHSIYFKPVAVDRLDIVERQTIADLEGQFALRNIFLASYPLENRDLDYLVPKESQNSFALGTDYRSSETGGRTDDAEQRQRYKCRFSKLCLHERFMEEGVPLLHEYLYKCIPFPETTELSFWAISCLPAHPDNEQIIFTRVNIYQQEVVTVLQDPDDRSLSFSFHLAISPFDELPFKEVRQLMEHLPYTSFDLHWYKSGGSDQWNIHSASASDVWKLMDTPVFLTAARAMNLRLMQKGPTRYSRYHCFYLADLLYSNSKKPKKSKYST